MKFYETMSDSLFVFAFQMRKENIDTIYNILNKIPPYSVKHFNYAIRKKYILQLCKFISV